ncbi:DMT family transporter [Mucilaginibacter sp.]|uniref:DMT family transporter n=1 Tax=Mucilaginibacter sp. TaxID=1882438 RepID=UPI002610324C|nr:DMT family transporter [Mucilaginibacter sp.]MDB5032574.1 family transporter [Mucilaginibacter sp.]
MNPKLSLAIGILCISFSPILVKLADASPLVCAFYRIFFAWIFLLPYCLYKKNLKMERKNIVLALIGGVVFASDIAVWNLSLKLISATVSTLLSNLAPVWVGLLSYLLFKKKSGSLFWIGTAIAVTGMVILIGISNLLHLQFNIGIVLAVASSLLYSIYILITKDILKRISTIPFMFYNMLASGVFLLILCGVFGNGLLHFNIKTWGCFAVMGIICQLTGWITINYAISHLESTKVALTLLSQTVIAGLLAVLILNESLQLKEIIGSVIVLAGIALTFLKQKAKQSI